MPRGRGGSRQGRPGVSYGNRTDLNAPKVARIAEYRGQPYGERTAQVEAQRAMPQTPSPPVEPPPRSAPPGPPPGGLGSLLDPTARPDEPITAGLPIGPGPGPEVLTPDPDAEAVEQLRHLYAVTQSPALRRLLEGWDDA